MNKSEQLVYSAMITQGLKEIQAPEMHQVFKLGKEKIELFKPFLDSLDSVLKYINGRDLDSIPGDMKSTQFLIQQRLDTSTPLPSPKNMDTHRNPLLVRTFTKTLKASNNLFGSYFHFHEQTYAENPQESDRLKLGATVVDGYSVFASLLYGIDSEHSEKFMEETANAICEVAVELGEKDAIFQMAKETKWYSPEYGFEESFLKRHGLLASA